jgi:hypothetical protein
MTSLKQILTIILFIILGSLGAWYMYSFHQEFLNFGIALILAILAVGGLWAVDKFLLVGYDILEEIKKGNNAASIALLAYAYIIGKCIEAAFTVFK